MTNRRIYGAALVALLLIELFIARFVHDDIVRPYVGDALAVMLAYAGFRAVFGLRLRAALLAAFLLACAIETGQAFDLVGRLGLAGVPRIRVVLGSSFDWSDFLAYASGVLAIMAIERMRRLSRSGR